MEPLFTNELVHSRQLGTHSREWTLLQKGDGKSSCRGASEDSFPPHHPGSCCLRPEELGCWLGLAWANAAKNCPVSADHLPPISPARTTNRHLPNWPVNSGKVRSLSFRAKRNATPFLVTVSKETQVLCVNGQLRTAEQTKPVHNYLQPPWIANSNWWDVHVSDHNLPPPSLHTCAAAFSTGNPRPPNTQASPHAARWWPWESSRRPHRQRRKKKAEGREIFSRATPGKAEDRFGSPDWWGKRWMALMPTDLAETSTMPLQTPSTVVESWQRSTSAPPFLWKPSANLWGCSCHPQTRRLLLVGFTRGKILPTWWREADVSEHSPSTWKVGVAWGFNPKIIVVATTGWRFQIIGRESAQLDQCAESRDLLALLNPIPPNDKGIVMYCCAFAEKLAIPINWLKHSHICLSWASAKSAVNCGLTDRDQNVARDPAQENNNNHAACRSCTNGIRSIDTWCSSDFLGTPPDRWALPTLGSLVVQLANSGPLSTERHPWQSSWLFWSSRPLPLECTLTCSIFESCRDGLGSPRSFGIPLPKFGGHLGTLSSWQIT